MTAAPKRFYQEVSLIEQEAGFAVALDGRVAKTVGRHPLVAPEAVAEVLQREWESQTEVIDLSTMPLTRLQGFVLDAGEEGQAQFAETILQYGESDLLCYRASEPELAERQQAQFGPFLDRAKAQGLHFTITEGLIPVAQPEATMEALRALLLPMPMAELFSRKLLTEILGSAILALYADQDPDAAFVAARLDEAFQAEKWGTDGEAQEKEQTLRADYDEVLRFLSLSS